MLGLVRDGDVVVAGSRGIEPPDEGGSGVEAAAEVEELDLGDVGVAGDKLDGQLLVVGLRTNCSGVKESRRTSIVSGVRVALAGEGLLLAVDDDVLADVLLDELVGGGGVVLEGLFKDGGRVGGGEGFKGDGGRVNRGGDVGEADGGFAGVEGEAYGLADDGEAGELGAGDGGGGVERVGLGVEGGGVGGGIDGEGVFGVGGGGARRGVTGRGWARAGRERRMKAEGGRMKRITAGFLSVEKRAQRGGMERCSVFVRGGKGWRVIGRWPVVGGVGGSRGGKFDGGLPGRGVNRTSGESGGRNQLGCPVWQRVDHLAQRSLSHFLATPAAVQPVAGVFFVG